MNHERRTSLLATVTLLNSTINAQVAGALPARAPFLLKGLVGAISANRLVN